MNRLPRVSGKAVIEALTRGGFQISHVRGSHHYLRKPGVSALVVIPVHSSRDLPLGTLRAILRQANLTTEEFSELLRH